MSSGRIVKLKKVLDFSKEIVYDSKLNLKMAGSSKG